jgi:hypothetical protein
MNYPILASNNIKNTIKNASFEELCVLTNDMADELGDIGQESSITYIFDIKDINKVFGKFSFDMYDEINVKINCDEDDYIVVTSYYGGDIDIEGRKFNGEKYSPYSVFDIDELIAFWYQKQVEYLRNNEER